MNHLYAPWRDAHQKNKTAIKKDYSCPFCPKIVENNDQKNLIVHRYKTCVVMLNIKPYGLGHVMIIPYKHVRSLSCLSQEERADLMESINHSMLIIESHFQCDGINVGMNKGKISGGSVEDHLHIHIVPRFIGDSGFLVTCAETRIHSFDINRVCKNLIATYQEALSR